MTTRQVAQTKALDKARSELLESVRLRPKQDRAAIESAIDLAIEQHAGQKRLTGEPYACHPLAAATIVAQAGGDTDTVIAAVLHDTVEDTNATLAQIASRFGDRVARIVDGCTKVRSAHVNGSGDHLTTARTRKFIKAVAQEPRVLLVKIADRMHNLSTSEGLEQVKAQAIGLETLSLHAPLARRLGLGKLADDIQEAAFKVADPEAYRASVKAIDKSAKTRLLGKANTKLEAHLRANGVDAQVYSRIKSPWSAHSKAAEEGVPIDRLADLMALRVIVETKSECYTALGLVHEIWTPVEGKIKDYIARPKFNSYQSLHTLVEVGAVPVEVQIRTRSMHAQAEHGSAAHHVYKSQEGIAAPWLTRLLQWADDDDYLEGIKAELASEDEVHALTPKGGTVTLPLGATIIDFAYAVHTEIGDRCSGARVNGRLVPLSTKLSTGDRVEVITQRTSGPDAAWLGWAVTHKARGRIRSYHGNAHTRKSTIAGRRALEKALAKRKITWQAWETSLKEGLTADRVCELVGRGELHVDHAADGKDIGGTGVGRSERTQLAARSLEGLRITMARCCLPAPGAAVIGILPSRNRRATMAHRTSCTRALERAAERPQSAIELTWVGPQMLWSTLEVRGQDRPGILADVTSAISAAGGEIETSSTSRQPDGTFAESFDVVHPRQAHLLLLRLVRNVSGVDSATLG